jgi:DNA repair photolyase
MITTKSGRVLRDLDLLAEMAGFGLLAVGILVTNLDPHLSRLLEPRAASPAKRLVAPGRLAEAGVPTHVSIAPVIPAITDEFIEAILGAAAKRGVRSASWIMIRLPHEIAPLFREWLTAHFLDRAAKVMGLIRAVRTGRDNDPEFGSRMKPRGVWAALLGRRFHLACKRNGIAPDRKITLDCGQFRRPNADGQLPLL